MIKKIIFFLLLCLSFSLLSAQGTLIWGPVQAPAQDSQGLYGICYNTSNDRIYYINLYSSNICYATSNSSVTYLGSIPTPNNNTRFVDIAYCNYDNTFWLLSNSTGYIYKIDINGSILTSFSGPATVYPIGITWDDATRTIYIADRLTAPPQIIYAIDTLGNVLNTMNHPGQGNLGSRCLAFQPGTNPYLLNAYTYFGSTLDSSKVFALNPQNGAALAGFIFQYSDHNNIRGIEFDPRDTSLWITNFSDG